MVYISNGSIAEKRSPWRLSIITDFISGIISGLNIFIASLWHSPERLPVRIQSYSWGLKFDLMIENRWGRGIDKSITSLCFILENRAQYSLARLLILGRGNCLAQESGESFLLWSEWSSSPKFVSWESTWRWFWPKSSQHSGSEESRYR